MKKIMFFALAAAGLFASCSSDDALTSDVQNPAQELEGREAIKIGLGDVSTITTKGTGTVGGVKNAAAIDHNWAGQEFKLFMFKYAMTNGTKGALTFNLAMNDLVSPSTPLFDDAAFTATGYAGEEAKAIADLTAATAVDGINRYYPNESKQAYEFFGYRVDDAANFTITNTKTGNAYDGDALKASFEIDGTQDVLLAKAEPIKSTGATVTDATELNNSFSAWASRNDIYPKLNFKHMLTRLTFGVKAGDAATAANVVVDSIWVLSKNDATMTIADIANTDINDDRIEWAPIVYNDPSNPNDDDIASGAAWFQLKTRTGTEADNLTKLPVNNAIVVADYTALGEAMMVKPHSTDELNTDGDGTYKVRVFITEQLDVDGTGAKPVKSFIEGTIKIAGGALRSTSYNVQITLYGHQMIEIFTSLEPWTNGGNIDVNDQDNWN